MKTHRKNRISKWLRPAVTSLEARSLLSTLPPTTSAASPPGTDVLTYHNDTSRTGANLNETTLTPQNVNASSFGKLFSYKVDGQVYAQPLEVSQVRMGDGKVHNVMFVATANIADPIPAPLRDRMEILEIPGYTRREKLAIARRHLIPKQLEEHGITKEQLDITDTAASGCERVIV